MSVSKMAELSPRASSALQLGSRSPCRAAAPPAPSHCREFRHYADGLSPSLLTRLLKVERGAAGWQSRQRLGRAISMPDVMAQCISSIQARKVSSSSISCPTVLPRQTGSCGGGSEKIFDHLAALSSVWLCSLAARHSRARGVLSRVVLVESVGFCAARPVGSSPAAGRQGTGRTPRSSPTRPSPSRARASSLPAPARARLSKIDGKTDEQASSDRTSSGSTAEAWQREKARVTETGRRRRCAQRVLLF